VAVLAGIRLLVLDVDGVLTDGGLYYSERGLELKRFHSRDGLGLKLIAQGGITLALLSGDPSPITASRARRLAIEHVILGADDKLETLEAFIATLGIALPQVAYMGDDLNDLPCLTEVGFGAVPSDAAPEARSAAHYVCALGGGQGAVREVCDLLRAAQNLPLPVNFLPRAQRTVAKKTAPLDAAP
ncbi:MAG: HAD-IIIA family hydrolase, partial [bacterium]